MPVMGGLATARALQHLAPALPILFVSQQAEAEYVEEAFRLGASGYLLKSALSSELGPVIEAIQNQQQYWSPQLKAQSASPPGPPRMFPSCG